MLRPLPTCIARAKNKIKNKSRNCPCRRDYITRELFRYNSRDQESHDRHRYPTRSEYAEFSQLLCSQSCTVKANTWTGVCRVDFGDPEREKGACDIEVDTLETLACVASISVGRGFCVRSKHFSLFGRAKTGASAKEVGEGEGQGIKEKACPHIPRF